MNQKIAIQQLKKIQKLIKNDQTRLAACNWNKNWQILIATILSAQTRDETTIPVCENLFKKYPSINALSIARTSTVERIIKKVNYHKTKAKHISKTAKMLKNKKIPKTLNDLIKLPGVGRKVANVYLVEAHNADAIGVDTHVKRISQKLNWSKNHDPHKIEKDLKSLFPKKYWRQINESLVRFGKKFGRSKRQEDEILAKLIKIK